jgi:hypothetical protein
LKNLPSITSIIAKGLGAGLKSAFLRSFQSFNRPGIPMKMSTQELLKAFQGYSISFATSQPSSPQFWARGAATADSDIDLVVVLKGKISPGREIDRMIDCITDLNLKYDTLISVVPVFCCPGFR